MVLDLRFGASFFFLFTVGNDVFFFGLRVERTNHVQSLQVVAGLLVLPTFNGCLIGLSFLVRQKFFLVVAALS